MYRVCVPCVCPGSPRCLFTGYRYARVRWWVGMVVRFGCPCVPCLSRVPCVSRLPPVSFYRYVT